MKRRNFIMSGIAVMVGGTLDKKEPRLLTPTHTVEAKSKTHPTEGIRFPCILKSDDELKVGSVVKVDFVKDWQEGGIEEFIVTKIEDTRDEHLEEFSIRVVDV